MIRQCCRLRTLRPDYEPSVQLENIRGSVPSDSIHRAENSRGGVPSEVPDYAHMASIVDRNHTSLLLPSLYLTCETCQELEL